MGLVRFRKFMSACVLMVWAFLSNAAGVAIDGNSTFDHSAWDSLLKKHVIARQDGAVTVVDYGGMKSDQANLQGYLQSLSKVSPDHFYQWSRNDQLAFLINAYNAATVALILTKWPDLDSIKDLGSVFRSPWRKKFVQLLGKTRTLDNIEHHLIRGEKGYQNPLIHFAVNCASIGCPALRAEAYQGDLLNQQLQQQTTLFLSDAQRNRLEGSTLYLSSIFKWYREDFEKNWHGYSSLEAFVSAYAKPLGINAKTLKALREGKVSIKFLAYDWDLNQTVNKR